MWRAATDHQPRSALAENHQPCLTALATFVLSSRPACDAAANRPSSNLGQLSQAFDFCAGALCAMPQVKKFFRPEFLNRLDDMVVFEPLSAHQLLGVARLMANELNERLQPKNITLQMTDTALQHAVAQAYEPSYGARPLRRWLEHTIITDLSRMIVAGELPDSSNVTCDFDTLNQQLVYRVEAKPLPPEAEAVGNFMGNLKRGLDQYGSNALSLDGDDEDVMEV